MTEDFDSYAPGPGALLSKNTPDNNFYPILYLGSALII